MIAVGYFDGASRRGLLVFSESLGGVQAIGGITPEEQGYVEAGATAPQTVITRDDCLIVDEWVVPGWVHPDNIGQVQYGRNYVAR